MDNGWMLCFLLPPSSTHPIPTAQEWGISELLPHQSYLHYPAVPPSCSTSHHARVHTHTHTLSSPARSQLARLLITVACLPVTASIATPLAWRPRCGYRRRLASHPSPTHHLASAPSQLPPQPPLCSLPAPALLAAPCLCCASAAAAVFAPPSSKVSFNRCTPPVRLNHAQVRLYIHLL